MDSKKAVESFLLHSFGLVKVLACSSASMILFSWTSHLSYSLFFWIFSHSSLPTLTNLILISYTIFALFHYWEYLWLSLCLNQLRLVCGFQFIVPVDRKGSLQFRKNDHLLVKDFINFSSADLKFSSIFYN